MAGGAEVDTVDPLDAGRVKKLLGGGPQIQVSLRSDALAEAGAVARGDLFAHLVAAGADPRPDDRAQLAAERRDARLDDPFEQSHAPRVEQGEGGTPVLAGQRDRQAV